MRKFLVDVGQVRGTLEEQTAGVQTAVNDATNAAMAKIKEAGYAGANDDLAEYLAGMILYYMKESATRPVPSEKERAEAFTHYEKSRVDYAATHPTNDPWTLSDWCCECQTCRTVRSFHAFTGSINWLPKPQANR